MLGLLGFGFGLGLGLGFRVAGSLPSQLLLSTSALSELCGKGRPSVRAASSIATSSRTMPGCSSATLVVSCGSSMMLKR